MKILAVDDEPSILELLKVCLEASGRNNVTVATSGKEALEITADADSDFQCFLLDIQMPEMNGVALCEQIRYLPGYDLTPIIMLTAMSQRQYIDQAFAVGATDYVTKPFDFTELMNRLDYAKRMSTEIYGGVQTSKSTKQIIQDITAGFLVGQDEPISLERIQGLVGYQAFENYVLQLSRAKLLFASTFAIKIRNFTELHEENSSIKLMDLVVTVARVIASNLSHSGNFISYRGNGIFLCISHKKTLTTAQMREAEINSILLCRGEKYLQEKPLRVVVGDEIPMRSISRSGAVFALRRAVTSVEDKALPLRDPALISKLMLRNQLRTVEQSKLEKRAYQIVLDDLLREEQRPLQ